MASSGSLPVAPREDRRKVFETVFAGIAAFATLVAAIVVWSALVTAKNQLQLSHLDSLEQRWAELSDVRDRVTGMGQTLTIDLFDTQKHAKEAHDIRAIGNFFELLGKKTGKKYVDADDACDIVGHWAEESWSQYKPAVERLRDVNHVPTLYINFQHFAEHCAQAH